jgi:hypothetical protein
MNQSQALTKLHKLLGKTAALRDNKRPSSPEIRAAQHAKRVEVNAAKDLAAKALEARKVALLGADAEYQRLLAEWRAARELQDKTPHGTTYRYTALTVGSWFATVQGEGDTLDELIANVEAKRAAA